MSKDQDDLLEEYERAWNEVEALAFQQDKPWGKVLAEVRNALTKQSEQWEKWSERILASETLCDCPMSSRGNHTPGGSHCWGPSL